jgi:hypothetical protein
MEQYAGPILPPTVDNISNEVSMVNCLVSVAQRQRQTRLAEVVAHYPACDSVKPGPGRGYVPVALVSVWRRNRLPASSDYQGASGALYPGNPSILVIVEVIAELHHATRVSTWGVGEDERFLNGGTFCGLQFGNYFFSTGSPLLMPN